MKRILLSIFFLNTLFAQETGTSALYSSETARSNDWQNWAFAGSALVTAGLGIFAITLSQGAHSH